MKKKTKKQVNQKNSKLSTRSGGIEKKRRVAIQNVFRKKSKIAFAAIWVKMT